MIPKKLIESFPGVNSISWSPNGKYIVTIEFRQTPPFQQSSPVPTQQPSAVVQVWVA
ncbi:MAG: hypothetical protein ACJ8AG_16155 [Ktedonobacteraceae bacterium]